MKLKALEELHKSMQQIDTELQQFRIKTGAIEFDCLFSIRDTPFTLSMTSRGLDPKFFLFQVKRGYWIDPYFGELYKQLSAALNTGANSGNKLMPKDWLSQVNATIPTIATLKRYPTNEEIIRLRPDITEERDNPYFDRWSHWKDGRKTSEKNLEKTRLLLGLEAVKYSIEMNASSCWSPVDLGRSDWRGQK
jgi:hypothetical protein